MRRLKVHRRKGDRLLMICSMLSTGGRHQAPLRADAAQQQLDDLIAEVRIGDPMLIEMVEQELLRQSRDADEPPPAKPDPERGRIRKTLAALGTNAPAVVRSPLRLG